MLRKSRDTTSAPGKASTPAPGKAHAHPPPRTRQTPREPAASGATPQGPATAPAAPVLLHEHKDGITLLTLDRPEARNCLSDAMLSALGEALAAIAKDASVRAVVIAANGPVFCAGHDLKELTAQRGDADGGRAYFARVMDTCSALMQSIVRLPQPVIAAVQGVATAAGCQLVASCDLAVASSAARFCTPGVDIGLFCSTPGVALARNVARKHALGMLLTGDMISAEHAERIGLINRVVSPGSERDEALALARKIAQKSTMTVQLGKDAFYRQIEMPLGDAYRFAAQVMVENMLRRDAAEGIGAFIDKRAPAWEDR
jgi:enoyl-CoA hydratase/carnithine racemase